MVVGSGNHANRICLHLLLLLLFSVNVAFAGTLVTSLPGFDGELPFKLYTGYVNMTLLMFCDGFSHDFAYWVSLIFRYVNVSTGNAEMFYYFIESEGNPKEDPVLLWYSGGPGCSAFNGLIYENGTISIPHAIN
jgi:serine carboxypeptidase-like clade 1